MAVPLLSAVLGYYARKVHVLDTNLAVLDREIQTVREVGLQRHTETLGVMKEMRDDVRDVRTSIQTIAHQLRS